jgi:hypothetical protein
MIGSELFRGKGSRLALLVAAMLAAAPVRAQDCRVKGDKIHWIADYCMAQLETDDEIPASGCIAKESKKRFTNDCAAKIYYKRQMCRLSVERKTRKGSVQSCEADGGFMGSTVRNGGVGR